jgi:hypothetical protein
MGKRQLAPAALTLVAAMSFSVFGGGVAQAAPPTVPAAPDVQLSEPGYNAVMLHWQVPADGGAPITSFAIKAYDGTTLVAAGPVPVGAVGSTLDPTPGAVDQFNVLGLTGGTAVTLTVTAVNSQGPGTESALTDPQATVTPSSTPVAPYAAIHVTATGSNANRASVSWIVPPDNGAPITSFTIVGEQLGSQYYDQTFPAGSVGSQFDPTPRATDSMTFSGLLIGGYRYTITANNADGPSSSFLGQSDQVDVGGPYFTFGSTFIQFGSATLGDFVESDIHLTDGGQANDTITNITFAGAAPDDFFTLDDCNNIAPGAPCTLEVFFNPGALGSRSATMTVNDDSPFPFTVSLSGYGSIGYYQFGAAGEVGNFGDAQYYGDASSGPLNRPIVGMAPTGDDGGYWLVASDGGIFSYGDANFFGSTGALRLNKPIVGMATTLDAGGYWMVASDGGIFAFGDAPFYGSTGALHLNKPIVGMAVTPDGGGYWLVASDGGIFSFGDAPFYGSTGAIHLNRPIVGMASTPDGGGYWLVASDGGIFAFGDAQFYGSTGATHLVAPIVGMTAMPDGLGYWLSAADGGVFAFGDAPFLGSVAQLHESITDAVGIATDGPPTVQAVLGIPADRSRGLTSHARLRAAGQAAPTSGRWRRP